MKCDYYPFGMEMPGRKITTDNYRYGYNGMEKDDEVKGNGNSYTTEFRQYDPRLGRWLSLDPLMHMFPSMSPYVAFDNNPIYFIDPLGLAAEGGPEGGEPKIGQSCRDEEGVQRVYQGDGIWGDGPNNGNCPTEIGLKIDPDKYYRKENEKWVERGLAYNDICKGNVVALLLEQERIDFNTKLKNESEQLEQARYNEQLAIDIDEASRNKMLMDNPITALCVMSPAYSLGEASSEAYNGKYLSATIIIAWEFAPGNVEDLVKSSRRIVKGEAKAGQHALRKKVQTKSKSKYFSGIKESQENAEDIIRNVMNSPNRIMGEPFMLGGNGHGSRKVIPFYNPDTGQGVAINILTGEFETFLNID
jgi:RHS repeat-associated protein